MNEMSCPKIWNNLSGAEGVELIVLFSVDERNVMSLQDLEKSVFCCGIIVLGARR